MTIQNQGGIGIGGLVVIALVGLLWYGSHLTREQNDKVQSNLSSIYMGESVGDVVFTLGEPDKRQHSETTFDGVVSRSDYLYYGDWQFAFDDGKLTSKNKY